MSKVNRVFPGYKKAKKGAKMPGEMPQKIVATFSKKQKVDTNNETPSA